MILGVWQQTSLQAVDRTVAIGFMRMGVCPLPNALTARGSPVQVVSCSSKSDNMLPKQNVRFLRDLPHPAVVIKSARKQGYKTLHVRLCDS
jgi:hypothetical protein